MPYQAKTDWKYDDTVTEKDMNRIEQGLKDAHVPAYQPLTLNPGLQVVEAEQDTPFRMGEIKGRTLINLLGRVGDCENTADWSAPGPGIKTLSTEMVYGSYSIEVASTKEEQGGFGLRTIGAVKDLDKYYIAVGYIRNISAQYVHLSFAEVKSEANVTSWFKSNKTVKSNQFTYAYVAVSPVDLAGKERVEVYVRGVSSGADQKIAADGIGLYEITEAEYNAIEGMTPEQVAERYPYVDSMTNVKNPYAIVTGGNLLPPFYEWATHTVNYSMDSPYEISINKIGSGTIVIESPRIPASAGRTYTISANVQPIVVEGSVYVNVIGLDEKGDIVLDTPGAANDHHHSFVVPEGVTELTARAIIQGVAPDGRYNLIIPILTIGTEPKPFVPQQRSILAFETELAAHPVDGSNPDTLFMGDDGLPYVLEKWGKVTLDGNMKYLLAHNGGDFRTFFTETLPPTVKDTAYVTKYDGKMLARRLLGQSITEGDTQVLTDSTDANPNRSVFSVFNTDSGWGPDYKLTEDDIKAYFLGWKMFDNSTNGDGTGVYNRTDGQHKAWTPLDSFDGNRYYGVYNGTDVPKELPNGTNTNVYAKNRSWQPYRLQYLKAKPTVEPVRNYELGAILSAGSNMVEVGSGIVIREKANPVDIGNGYVNLNDKGLPPSPLGYPTNNILAIYQNQAFDPQWNIMSNHPSGYGGAVAQISRSNFDPSAVYHVTYTMLDPTLAASISGTVAANLRGTVSDLVQDVGDVQRRLSVSEVRLNSITSDLNSPLEWITATLLSGWKSVAGRPVQYAKDSLGFVHFRGALDSGEAAKAVGTDIFILPVSYRPPRIMGVPTVTYGSPQDIQAYAIDVGNGGSVRVTMENTRRFVHLETLSFYAGGGAT